MFDCFVIVVDDFFCFFCCSLIEEEVEWDYFFFNVEVFDFYDIVFDFDFGRGFFYEVL